MASHGAIAESFRIALPDSVGALSVSPADERIAVATLAGPVWMVDRVSGKLLRQTDGHTGGALAAAFHPTDGTLVTAGEDGAIQWVNDEGSRQVRPATPRSAVSHLAWDPNGSVLVAATGRTLLAYDHDGRKLGQCSDFASTILSLAYAEPLGGFLSACYGGVHIVDGTNMQRVRCLFARTSLLTAEASPCGRFVAAGAQDPVVRVWDLHNDDECVHLEGYRGKISLLQWGREQSILATAAGPSVVLWSFASGDPHATPHVELSPHPARVLALAFSEDGKSLWTGCADGTLRLFDLTASLEPVFSVNVGAPVHLLRVLPQSTLVATTAGTLAAFGLSRQKSRKQRKREQLVQP